MLRDEKRYNLEEFIGLLEEWKGKDTWRKVAERCKIKPCVISLIRSGDYRPGYKTIMRLACVAPLEERNNLYNKLLVAAGLGRYWHGQDDH